MLSLFLSLQVLNQSIREENCAHHQIDTAIEFFDIPLTKTFRPTQEKKPLQLLQVTKILARADRKLFIEFSVDCLSCFG